MRRLDGFALAALLIAGALPHGGRPAHAAGAPAAPLTPDEMRELEDVERIVEAYEGVSAQQRKRVTTAIKGDFDERANVIEGKHKKEIEVATSAYVLRHRKALEELERFVKKHPNDTKWSASAMFRLAELYLDQAGIEYEVKQQQADAGGDLEGAALGPDYSRAIDLYAGIVQKFPDYRQVDGALYLLGYYNGEMGRTAEAKQAFLGLVCANKFDGLSLPPKATAAEERARAAAVGGVRPVFSSPYDDCVPKRDDSAIVDEAWVRIGETHFDTRGELDLAIAAYKKVAPKSDSKFYYEALYKLAWSYYRNDQFMEGINSFDQLVLRSDEQEATGGDSAELRQESVDYIAISFADPWEKDGQPDPAKSMERISAYYKGRTERHVRDVYEKLGDTLRIGDAYEQAAQAWRTSIEGWPLHARAPLVQQKIIDALAEKGDADGAMAQRKLLAVTYGKGTPWYTANETNREAMEYASRLAEQSLIAAAKSTHGAAQRAYQEWSKSKAPEARTSYLKLYDDAAKLYEAYLVEFPISGDAYELTYRLADCYFFGEQYLPAVTHYRWVRDHKDLGTKYFEPATLSIKQAFEAAVDRAKTDGTLVEPPIPTPEILAKSSEPLPIPDLFRDLQQSYDEYMTLINDEKLAPTLALASAMISYRHLQLDDALARFSVVMNKYCKTAEAVQAKDGILVIYDARGNDDKFKETTDLFVDHKCGEDKDLEIAHAQKLSKEAQIAARLYKEGKLEEAGLKFYALYKAVPDAHENRDDYLFSSAVAMAKTGKPKTAVAIYLEFSKVASFSKSEYFVEAIYNTAINYAAGFDYDNAVDAYLRVVDLAGETGRKAREGFDMPQARLDALWNAALLRDLDRVYYDRGKDPGAATLYKRYAAAETKDRKRASEAYFRAALVYEKAGDTKNMTKAFQEWRKEFGKEEGAGAYYVLSQYKVAKALLDKEHDKKAAAEAFRATIKAFDEVGEKPGSPSAELAGEAQFWLAEQYYKSNFEPYKVKWLGNIADKNPKKAEKALLDTLDSLKKVTVATADGYNAVVRFQSSWSLAATVRLGDMTFFAAQKLQDAPVPSSIEKLEEQFPGAVDAYRQQMEQMVAPQVEDGKNFWLKAIAAAKGAGVANQWSKLALQRLNAYVAADLYPVQHDELVDREVRP